MAISEALQARRSSLVPLTASGAVIESITADAARNFVERYVPANETPPVLLGAWGAFEHSEALIGVAWFAASPSRQSGLAVAPERRRLGVGSDLLQFLVDEARIREMTAFASVHAANDPGPPRMIASLKLTAARRVHEVKALTVVFVPNPLCTTTKESHEHGHTH